LIQMGSLPALNSVPETVMRSPKAARTGNAHAQAATRPANIVEPFICHGTFSGTCTRGKTKQRTGVGDKALAALWQLYLLLRLNMLSGGRSTERQD
jgi:hypothetical protein